METASSTEMVTQIISQLTPSIGKLHKLGHFMVVVQLILGLANVADISCKTATKQA